MSDDVRFALLVVTAVWFVLALAWLYWTRNWWGK